MAQKYARRKKGGPTGSIVGQAVKNPECELSYPRLSRWFLCPETGTGPDADEMRLPSPARPKRCNRKGWSEAAWGSGQSAVFDVSGRSGCQFLRRAALTSRPSLPCPKSSSCAVPRLSSSPSCPADRCGQGRPATPEGAGCRALVFRGGQCPLEADEVARLVDLLGAHPEGEAPPAACWWSRRAWARSRRGRRRPPTSPTSAASTRSSASSAAGLQPRAARRPRRP